MVENVLSDHLPISSSGTKILLLFNRPFSIFEIYGVACSVFDIFNDSVHHGGNKYDHANICDIKEVVNFIVEIGVKLAQVIWID